MIINNKFSYRVKPLKCKCGKEMELDDIDKNFKGNQDEIWICADDACCIYAEIKVRYSKICSIKYFKEGKLL